VDGAAGGGAEAGGESVEAGFVAGDEDEIVAATREPVCVDGADAGGGAGNEGSAFGGWWP